MIDFTPEQISAFIRMCQESNSAASRIALSDEFDNTVSALVYLEGEYTARILEALDLELEAIEAEAEAEGGKGEE